MASYTDVFGGETLYPAGQTYLGLTYSTDQDLSWPIEQQIGGNIVASIIDLNPTAAGLNIDLPDARQVSTGVQSVFNNVGGDTTTVRDAGGGTIISLGAGEAWVAYLTDNSTLAGTWRIFQLGASVSVANASALAGAGLKAIGSTLNQRIAPTSLGVSPVTLVNSHRAQMTIWTGGVGILNLPTAATVGNDWFTMVRNSGSGDLTVTPTSGTIDGASTLVMAPGESAIILTDGSNWFTVGYGQSTSSIFDFIQIAVAGSGNYTLSGVELNRVSYRFTGILTGNRTIIVPSSVQQYWVDNSTTGAFSLFISTSTQVGPPEVVQGGRNILYCDGADVFNAESNTIGFPVSIAQGGTGSTTAAGALSNLGAVADTIEVQTAALSGLAGGGDLSTNRALSLDSDNLTAESVIDLAADTVPFYDNTAGAMRKTVFNNIFPLTLVGARKSSATDRSSDITPTSDPTLSALVLGRVGMWEFEFFLLVRDLSGTSNGIRIQFATSSVSSTNQIWWWGDKLFSGSSALNLTALQTLATQDILPNTSGAGTTRLYIKGFVQASTIAATLSLQWAQENSNASAVRMDAGSSFAARFMA